jgi:hypothetical protein
MIEPFEADRDFVLGCQIATKTRALQSFGMLIAHMPPFLATMINAKLRFVAIIFATACKVFV